jgi:ArsR family transcriptional regulator
MGRIAKALGDETRLRIFEAISTSDGNVTCSDLVQIHGVSAATISHHVKILSDAGLITNRREGQFVCSVAVPETLEEYTRALLKLGRGKKG